jgi:hypothetical protein
MADDGKRTELACTKVTERMYIDANRVAAMDDRSLSDWLFMLVRRELYGRTVKLPSVDVGLQDTTK